MFIFKFFRSSSYFSRLLLYFTITVIICVLISSSILLFNFEKAAVSFIYTAIKDSLNQISFSTDYMGDTAKILATQIYYDNLLNKLLCFTNLDRIYIKQGLDKLNGINNVSSFVHSIYLFNSNINSFYITNDSKVIDKNSFFDKDVLPLLKEQSASRNFKPLARSIPAHTDYPAYSGNSNVYTFIYTEYPSTPDRLKSAVVINIHDYFIRNIIDSVSLNTPYKVLIIDKKGTIVSNNNKDKVFEDISDKSYTKKILGSSNSSGYFIDNDNGKKHLITFVNSANTDWVFVQLTPYTMVSKKIQDMRKSVFIIVLFIFTAGLSISFYMSRKLYIPYKNVSEKLDALEDEKRSSFQLNKQQFLRNLVLNNSLYNHAEIEKNKELYSITLDFDKPFFVVMFKIKNYRKLSENNKFDDKNPMTANDGWI
jgi:two-component system, response regulator YesN